MSGTSISSLPAVFSPLESSDLLRELKPVLEANWNRLLSSLPDVSRQQYRATLKQERDPARHLLFLYFLYCGAIEGEIQSRGNTYFHMGLPVDSSKLSLMSIVDSGPGDFRVIMRLHRDSVELVQPIFHDEILPLARQMLLYDTGLPGRNWIDYLHILESFVSRQTRKLIADGQPITFAHFRFQNLNHYFALLGEAGAAEMIEHIDLTIRPCLEAGEVSIVLSPHSYLVLAPGRTHEEIYQRFQALYFEIKSLILDYALLIHTVHEPEFSLFDVFRELKI